jgi:hypothetical protein
MRGHVAAPAADAGVRVSGLLSSRIRRCAPPDATHSLSPHEAAFAGDPGALASTTGPAPDLCLPQLLDQLLTRDADGSARRRDSRRLDWL